MRNSYTISGPTTVVYCKDKAGETHRVLVDTDAIQLLRDLDIFWQITTNGYVLLRIGKQFQPLHSLIMGNPDPEKVIVVHRGGNKLDNRRSNLVIIPK